MHVSSTCKTWIMTTLNDLYIRLMLNSNFATRFSFLLNILRSHDLTRVIKMIT